MNKLTEMKKLVEELNTASDAYYNGKDALMSDAEFDSKLKHLEKLEKELHTVLTNSPTINVGAPVLNKLEKVKHEYKDMLSLEKVHSVEEIIDFSKGQELIAMIKLDGLSVRLVYEEGELVRAATRGNGSEGSLITNHVKQFKNIPIHINKKGTYIVDGEAIIDDKDFEKINSSLPEDVEKFKNSRNLASGTLALLDTSLVKERYLQFILWDIIVGENSNKFFERIENAKQLGFKIVPAYTTELDKTSVSKCINLVFENSKELFYPIDGVVFKFNDIEFGKKLGKTAHHFCDAIAYKAADETYETVLKDIEWNTTRTGLINPTAVFDTVNIQGSDVSRATLHNLSYIEELELGYGDIIEVYKSNMIIPKVHDNLTRSNTWSYPTECPCCGHSTEVHNANGSKTLHCTNPDCPAQFISKLTNFVSKNGMNIVGLSENTLEILVERNYVTSFVDLYHLEDYKKELSALPGFGAKSVSKLLKSINESRTVDLEHLITAMGINLIGKSTAKLISKHCNGDVNVFSFILDNTSFEFASINGVGVAATTSLDDWWLENKDMFYSLLEELSLQVPEEKTKDASNSNILEGMNFVVTGSVHHFKNRNELSDRIIQLGGKVSGSVSTKTSYLICNEVSDSGKSKKARELGIPQISEDDFLEMIKEN